jgi:hypothetical protein
MSTYNFIFSKLAAEEAIIQVLLNSNRELKQLAKDMKDTNGMPDELSERYQELVGE